VRPPRDVPVRAAARADHGFTLIEVLAAVLIVSLVFGLLLESVTRNLAELGRARLEARAAALAETRVTELQLELGAGTALEDGEKDGTYEPPDDDLRWTVRVSALTLPLPADYPGEKSPSPIFALPGKAAPPLPRGQTPPLRMVEVRVFPADEADPNSVEPTVLLVTSPPDPARLQQLQQQGAQNPQQSDRNGMQPPQQEPD
jgi:prepilin-type N-terminal cleavage/methylation domain-containing protein